MATNEFLPFGVNAGANVISQAEYAALASRVNGFSAGTAASAQLNKAWRQSSVIASVVAQYIADNSGSDVLDNGSIAPVLNNLSLAISNVIKGAGVAWDKVTGKPTTAGGYGITDLYTKTQVDAALLLKANSSDVDQALSLKANTTDVNQALALKANNADVVQDLAGKANKNEVYLKTETYSKPQIDDLLTPISNQLNPATTAAQGLVRLATVVEARAMENALVALTPYALDQAFRGQNQATNAQRLPGGWVIQRGSAAIGSEGSGGLLTITLPVAYPNGYSIIASYGYTGNRVENANYAQWRNKTPQGFVIDNQWTSGGSDIGGIVDWITIGNTTGN